MHQNDIVRSTHPNPAPVSIVAEMTEKLSRLSIPRNISYRPVLIYAGVLSPALEESDYFSAKIDLGEFLR